MQFHHYNATLHALTYTLYVACDNFNEKCAYHKIRLILQVFFVGRCTAAAGICARLGRMLNKVYANHKNLVLLCKFTEQIKIDS